METGDRKPNRLRGEPVKLSDAIREVLDGMVDRVHDPLLTDAEIEAFFVAEEAK